MEEDIIAALETGHKASSVLRDVLEFLRENCYCPESNGFEGPNTFPECGECPICIANKVGECA